VRVLISIIAGTKSEFKVIRNGDGAWIFETGNRIFTRGIRTETCLREKTGLLRSMYRKFPITIPENLTVFHNAMYHDHPYLLIFIKILRYTLFFLSHAG
jgi:hypothetical protein